MSSQFGRKQRIQLLASLTVSVYVWAMAGMLAHNLSVEHALCQDGLPAAHHHDSGHRRASTARLPDAPLRHHLARSTNEQHRTPSCRHCVVAYHQLHSQGYLAEQSLSDPQSAAWCIAAPLFEEVRRHVSVISFAPKNSPPQMLSFG